MKILTWFLAAFFLFSSASAYANAVARTPPAHSPRFANAVDGVITARMRSLGFAANDPRYIGTRGAVFGGLGAGAAAAGAAVVGAITWPAVLGAVGIGAVLGGAVALVEYGLDRWAMTDTQAIPQGAQALPTGWWYRMPNGGSWFRDAGQCTASLGPSGNFSCGGQTLSMNHACEVTGTSTLNGLPIVSICNSGCTSGRVTRGCGSHMHAQFLSSNPTGSVLPPAPANAVPLNNLWDRMTDEQWREPLNPAVVAAAANAAWRNAGASAPLPWSASDPIRPEEVEQWRAANPSLWPTVGDFVGPVGPGAGRAVSSPVSAPGVDSSSWPVTVPSPAAPASSPLDLGPDPMIRGLDLQEAPTPEAILAPILALMPDLRNYTVDLSPRSCPVVSIELFGTRYTMDAQCSLIAPHEAFLRALAIFAWTLLAAFIVLRA